MITTTVTAADLMAILPELALTGAAFALLLLDLFVSERQRGLVHGLAVAALIAVAGMIALGTGGDAASLHGRFFDGMFLRDTMADVLKWFVCIVSAASLVYAWSFLRERGLYKGEVSLLMLFAVVGMMLLISAGSLVMVYLGLEMLALCSYALVAIATKTFPSAYAGVAG